MPHIDRGHRGPLTAKSCDLISALAQMDSHGPDPTLFPLLEEFATCSSPRFCCVNALFTASYWFILH